MTLLRLTGRAIYRGWMKFAHVLGIVNTTVILVLVYILIIGPFWLVMTLMRRDLLGRRFRDAHSFWKPKDPVDATIEGARRQF